MTVYENKLINRIERQYNRVSADHIAKADEIIEHVNELMKTNAGRAKCLRYRTMIDLVKMIQNNNRQDLVENGVQVGQILRMTERYLS